MSDPTPPVPANPYADEPAPSESIPGPTYDNPNDDERYVPPGDEPAPGTDEVERVPDIDVDEEP